jgi:indole-3-glycerol phosphate synthase
MSDMLARICADKREHVTRCKSLKPFSVLLEEAERAPPPHGFADRLARTQQSISLICEIKRASPSAGLIRTDFNARELARAYRRGGAVCLSVVTDTPYFEGRDAYLTAARAAVDLPVLRKDFILDPYQVMEARALGADCVILIMAALDDEMARELEALANAHGMDTLIEVHNEAELGRALRLKSRLIGVNNRDLNTLEVDLTTTERLAPLLPPDRLLVSESGIRTPEELARLSRVGADAFLVGESLMRQPDVAAATRALLGQPAAAEAGA